MGYCRVSEGSIPNENLAAALEVELALQKQQGQARQLLREAESLGDLEGLPMQLGVDSQVVEQADGRYRVVAGQVVAALNRALESGLIAELQEAILNAKQAGLRQGDVVEMNPIFSVNKAERALQQEEQLAIQRLKGALAIDSCLVLVNALSNPGWEAFELLDEAELGLVDQAEFVIAHGDCKQAPIQRNGHLIVPVRINSAW